MNEKLYISPFDFAAPSDAAAIQAAVDEAKRTDIRTVVIPQKPGGDMWQVDETVLLPSCTTIILDGCTIRGSHTIFANANAWQEDTKTLGGEEHDLFLIGRNGACLTGEGDAPEVFLSNVRDFRIAGIAFVRGGGLHLHFTRTGKVQQLSFENSRYGIALCEGCSGLIINDIDGVTREETILMRGGKSVLYGRDPDIRKSIVSRIRAKTGGAPAIGLYAGAVPMSYLFLRDITDQTEGEGVSVRLGETQKEIRDITIRGVQTLRTAVETTAVCDGLHCAGLRGGFAAKEKNIRSRVDETMLQIALPCLQDDAGTSAFLICSDPTFYGDTDARTIQNTIDAAVERGGEPGGHSPVERAHANHPVEH